MSLEALVLIVALFVGPNDGSALFVFSEPKFQTKESCAQYVKKNAHNLNVYLSNKYDTLPKIYSNIFYCTNAKELKNYFDRLKEMGTLI